MNYLAHCFLSCDQPHILIGNFMADHINNTDLHQLPDSILQGIYLHRAIDTFTDTHPLVAHSTALLHPKHSKYSPILIDIYFDYLLVQNWSQFTTISLNDFTTHTYNILTQFRHYLPQSLNSNLDRMINADWLTNYGTTQGLQYTFSRISKRLSQPDKIKNATETLIANNTQLNQYFLAFFPDLYQFTQEYCQQK